MNYHLTILASASGSPVAGKLNQSAQYLVFANKHILIDCGEATQQQLVKLKLGLMKIEQVYISHLHADHFMGLIGLINSFNLNHRQNKLEIFGPPGLENIIQTQLTECDIRLRYPLEFHHTQAKEPKTIFSNDKFTVETIPLAHRLPTTGFIFREINVKRNIDKSKIVNANIPYHAFPLLQAGKDIQLEDGRLLQSAHYTLAPRPGKSYAYFSDTGYNPHNTKYLKDVEVLYHEATFGNDLEERALEAGHSTIGQALRMAEDAGIVHLILGHLSSRYQNFPEINQHAIKQVSVAVEGFKIEL